jgi:hypothetical protein
MMQAVGVWLDVVAAKAKTGIFLPGYCEVPDAVRADGAGF